jgi:hypothetical protein
MGIGAWVRRLFASIGVSGPTVPCDQCRCDIPLSDFEKGLAVMVARQKYCHGCIEEITRNAKGRGLSLDMGSSSTVYLR